MRLTRGWGWVVVTAGMILASDAGGLVAQDSPLPNPALSLIGGTMSFDNGIDSISVDNAAVVGLRFELPLSRIFTLEPGVEHATWTDPDEVDQIRWTVDFAMHAEWAFGRFVPYAGGNLGTTFNFADDRPADADFVSALYGGHAGLRVEVIPHLLLRGEVRHRWYDGFDASQTLYAAGVGWRF
jgi:hypothetical protein